jgi:putative thioredoxin
MEFGAARAAPANGGPGDQDLVKESSTAAFTRDVIEASRSALVIVDFWAPWCAPCKRLTPILEKVVRSYGGKVRLVKINADEHPALTGQLRIQSLPTVYAFRDGRPLDGFMGDQPESAVRAMIDRALGEDAEADIAAVLAAADEAREAGDLQGAAEAYAAILQQDQQHAAALAGLAQCYLASGDADRAEQMIALVPPDKRSLSVVQGVKAALDLVRMAGEADNSTDLARAVEANPADHQSRFDLAVGLAARGHKAEALDHLLEIVKRQRAWNEEAARKQLVQLFDAWGPKDPLTLEGRRRLSSLLFS